ncbi:TetR/AcrR family transcriptional regulator [Neobacillus niacini]|uniref:TetR/AcrR family transcriptional regulator n=1 Tax=Neobacillus niacini TaxID=86668 RepID=UPI0007AB3E02|nr:TetR/AcrR family transcriptional regulator [Neobacillus niacini]MEC1523879.1 TetR/AcrR family transcriptional regulator [Neobacillus niacini]
MTNVVQSKNQDRKAEILDQALTLFVKKGFNRTSIQDIADAAGITKGGLYHYLKSKEEILFLLHERFITEGLSKLKVIAEETLPTEEKLVKLLKVHLEIIKDFKDDITIFYKEYNNLSPENYQIVLNNRDEYEGIFINVLEEGRINGVFNVENSRIASFFILGASNFMYHWYNPNGEKPLDEIAKIYLNIIKHGILND